jgi:hypothetical protein
MTTKNKGQSQRRSKPRGRPRAKSQRNSADVADVADVDPIRETASKLILLLSNSKRADVAQAGFLERWVATYVAELLDAEGKSSGSERTELRKEIAGIIPALWEQQLQRAALAVRRETEWEEPRLDTADASTITLLRKILANPSCAPDLASNSKIDVMRWLIAAERRLINYVLVNRAARDIAGDSGARIAVDVLRTFLRDDKESKQVEKFVFRLVPSLKRIEIGRLCDDHKDCRKRNRTHPKSAVGHRDLPRRQTERRRPDSRERRGKTGQK